MNTPTLEKRYLTVEQLAEYIQVLKWSIYKLVDRRRIPFIGLTITGDDGKKAIRFDIRAIDKWMNQRSVSATMRPQG